MKRSARAILDADTLANSGELFMKLNWLPLHAPLGESKHLYSKLQAC